MHDPEQQRSTQRADGRPSRRRSAAEGLALVSEWRSSGKTAAQFCRDRGLPEHRLHYWKRRAATVSPVQAVWPAAESAFYAMEVDGRGAMRTPVEGAQVIEICAGSCISVHLPLDVSQGTLVEILRAVAEAVRS